MKFIFKVFNQFVILNILLLVKFDNVFGQVKGIVPPGTCTITVQELQDLLDAINNFDKTRSGRRIIIPPREKDSAETCSDMINEMKTGIDELSNIYQQLLDESVSQSEYDALKASYEEKIKELNKEFDDLQQAANEQSQREIQALKDDLQDLQASLNEALRLLEIEREKNRELTIQLCGLTIVKGDISGALNLWHELDDNSLIDRVIKDGFNGNIVYYQNCVDFIEGTYEPEVWAYGYSALLDQMENYRYTTHQKMFDFGYNILQILLKTGNPELEKYRPVLDGVKARLPSCVHLIIWSQRVCLKMTYVNEYIYGPNDYFAYDSDRGRVFTWKPGNAVSEARWVFETQNRGEYFYILNTYLKQYLYSPNDYFNYDNDRREVFMWRPGTRVGNGDWIVEIVNYDTIYLKSRTNNQYLYAANTHFQYDSDRRRIFTWIPGTVEVESPIKVTSC